VNLNGHEIARIVGIFVALGLGGVNQAGAQEIADRADVSGTWAGTLDAAGQELRLVFHIVRDSAGQLSGKMDSPDQGAYGLALSAVEGREDGSVRFEFSMAGGEFTGQLLRSHSPRSRTRHRTSSSRIRRLESGLPERSRFPRETARTRRSY